MEESGAGGLVGSVCRWSAFGYYVLLFEGTVRSVWLSHTGAVFLGRSLFEGSVLGDCVLVK